MRKDWDGARRLTHPKTLGIIEQMKKRTGVAVHNLAPWTNRDVQLKTYRFTGARFMRGTTRVPVQMIWGDQDPALSVSLTKGLIHYAPEYRVDLVQGAGHYVTHEASLRVTRLLLDWMR